MGVRSELTISYRGFTVVSKRSGTRGEYHALAWRPGRSRYSAEAQTDRFRGPGARGRAIGQARSLIDGLLEAERAPRTPNQEDRP